MRIFVPVEDEGAAFAALGPQVLVPYRVGLGLWRPDRQRADDVEAAGCYWAGSSSAAPGLSASAEPTPAPSSST